MSLTAYIRYDSKGRIVPSGPIVTKTKPTVGNWQVVTEGTSVTLVGQLRAFVKLDRYNKPLAGSLFLGKSKPATGKWLEVDATFAGSGGSSTTTTTTTTTIPSVENGFSGFQNFNANVNTVYISYGYDINTVFINFDVIPGSLST